MNLFPKIKQSFSVHYIRWLMAAAFLVWVLCFRGYLSGRLSLVADAVSYYDHIKFFVQNLMQGVFPLWDPTWYGGATNEFFLRRIGPYNPFLLIIAVIHAAGVPYTLAYLVYMALYWFIGCAGFYLLANRILKDRPVAYAAFLMLLFSSFGTRMFDSYLHLIFVPLIWFFFFMVAFCQDPQRKSFLGMTFCLMIIFTTYIPFYFVTILASFIFCFGVICFAGFKTAVLSLLRFMWKEKIFVAVCLALLAASLIPGFMFFTQKEEAEFVLPGRAANAVESNVLGVEDQMKNSWSVIEELTYTSFFWNFDYIQFAIFYLPVFVFSVLSASVICRLNRCTVLLFGWMFLLFVITTPLASPLYMFLFNNVFFFKYFRNLHFVLWLAILPALILFLAEQLRLLIRTPFVTWPGKVFYMLFIISVHMALLYFFLKTEVRFVTTYVCLAGSGILLLLAPYFLNGAQRILAGVLFILIAMQPYQVYRFFESGIAPAVVPYSYDHDFLTFAFERPSNINGLPGVERKERKEAYSAIPFVEAPAFYYASNWYSMMTSEMNYYVADEYLTSKFRVYDNAVYINPDQMDFKRIEKAFWNEENIAFIFSGEPVPEMIGKAGPKAEVIRGEKPYFKVTRFTANSLRIETDFPTEKFLVYNDNVHSKWRASVNKKPVTIYRSNIAFKGVYLPPGKNIVEFKFGTWKDYVLNYGLLFTFYGCLVWLGILCVRKKEGPS